MVEDSPDYQKFATLGQSEENPPKELRRNNL